MEAQSLFSPDVPPGFSYQDDFIDEEDELALLDAAARISFIDFEMRGVVARRRVAFYGESYRGETAEPIPPFLLPLRARLAEWAKLSADAFSMALINEYPPGAPIGWHRDAPQYDVVAGISLGSACRMKFRPYRSARLKLQASARRSTTHSITLNRRSAYLMAGDARSAYEHHIPPVEYRRYSITFRTFR